MKLLLTILTLFVFKSNLALGQGMGPDYHILQVRLDLGNLQQGETRQFTLPRSQWSCQATNYDNAHGMILCYLKKDRNVFVTTNVVCHNSEDGDFFVANESAKLGFMVMLGCH